MKDSKMFLLAMLIIPWLTVPFLGKNEIRKYLPAAIFMSIFTKALDLYGEKKKWWQFYKGKFDIHNMNFFNFGPYLVTSLWMLKLTYRKFPLFLVANSLLQFLFIAFGLKYIRKHKIFSLTKLTKTQYLFIDLIRTIVLYSFQYISDLKLLNKSMNQYSHKEQQ